MTDQRKGSDAEPTTHFGFKNVPESQKAEKVAEVFHSVAAKYDLMNDVLSGGMHRLWKRFTIELSGVRTGNRVLDIAGGTGDLAAKFSRWSARPARWCWPTSTIRCSRSAVTACSTGRGRQHRIRPGRRGSCRSRTTTSTA
jgi:hypothetical protein